MHPAFSVIFLTTLIGVGQGIFLALFTVESYAAFGLLPVQEDSYYAIGCALSLLFLIAGLIASLFHLGRPERAWRSAAQWRTSWLSREVVALPAFMGALALYGLAHLIGFNPTLTTLPSGTPVTVTLILGTGATLLAFALFLCTGMIYACLRFIQAWHSPLTVINYVLFGGASGFTLAAAHASIAAPDLVIFLAGWALVITLLGLTGWLASRTRNTRIKPKSTLPTAIGIKHPHIAQASQGLMGGSFNTREFFHGNTQKMLQGLQGFSFVCAFVLPTVLLVIGLSSASSGWLLTAFICQYAGLLAERWLFFAQARHPQNLYYQAVA